MKPNPARVVNEWLTSLAAVTDVCGHRVSYRLTGTYPAIRVADLGPGDLGPEEGLYRVQVECWADDYDTAAGLAGLVHQAVTDRTARGAWAGAYCAGASVETGPFSSPDTTSERYRHMLDVGLWLYPDTTTGGT